MEMWAPVSQEVPPLVNPSIFMTFRLCTHYYVTLRLADISSSCALILMTLRVCDFPSS